MGDPRRQRRKYTRPTHLWRTARIEEESGIEKKYGLKSKTEIWRARAGLARIRNQAVKLLSLSGERAEKDKNELLERLTKAGLLKTGALDGVLALTVEDFLERRLQTIVYRKGIAKTLKQARQLITHGQVVVGDTFIDIPRYPVKVAEEESVRLKEGFSLPVEEAKPAKAAPPKAEEPAEAAQPVEGVSIGKEA